MDKTFIIKQWLKDSGHEYYEYRHEGLDVLLLRLEITGEEIVENVHILLEGSPAYGTVDRCPAADEVMVVIEFFDEDNCNGEAWVVISLADPNCFYEMDDILRQGLAYPAKWKFEYFE